MSNSDFCKYINKEEQKYEIWEVSISSEALDEDDFKELSPALKNKTRNQLLYLFHAHLKQLKNHEQNLCCMKQGARDMCVLKTSNWKVEAKYIFIYTFKGYNKFFVHGNWGMIEITKILKDESGRFNCCG